MTATIYDIQEQRRAHPVALATVDDFDLWRTGATTTQELLDNPQITLYSLDFSTERAVFVETPAAIDLSHAPFFYMAQYEHAVRVLTVSFDAMLQMAQSVELDDEKLIFIHSVGRAGSTLAGQVFAQIDGVTNLSEPDVLTLLVIARFRQPGNEAAIQRLLEACIRLLCKTPVEIAWVIKGRGFVIELADWLHQMFPGADNLFLYRNAESWLRSNLRAFGSDAFGTGEERIMLEREIRKFMAPASPLLAAYDPNKHLTIAEVLALVWLALMERYLVLNDMGIEMLAIRYSSWRDKPRQTAVAMLDYCGCDTPNLSGVYAALTRDSQAGTILSRENVQENEAVVLESDLNELRWHIQNHSTIRTAGFDVPNTL